MKLRSSDEFSKIDDSEKETMMIETRMHKVKLSNSEHDEASIEKKEDNTEKQVKATAEREMDEHDPEIENKMSSAKAIIKDIQSILDLAEITDMKMENKERLKHYHTVVKTVIDSIDRFKIAK